MAVLVKVTKQAFCSPSLVRYYNSTTYKYDLRYKIRRGNIIITNTYIASTSETSSDWTESKASKRTVSKQAIGHNTLRIDVTTRDREVPVDDYFEVW